VFWDVMPSNFGKCLPAFFCPEDRSSVILQNVCEHLTTRHHIEEGSHHHSSVDLEMFHLVVIAMNEHKECFKSGF
jgi:hypothetical protein